MLAGYTSQSQRQQPPAARPRRGPRSGTWLTANNQNHEPVGYACCCRRRPRLAGGPRRPAAAGLLPGTVAARVRGAGRGATTPPSPPSHRHAPQRPPAAGLLLPAGGGPAVRVLFKNGYGGTQLGIQTIWVYLARGRRRHACASWTARWRATAAWPPTTGTSATAGTSADRDPVHTYAGPGEYEVVLWSPTPTACPTSTGSRTASSADRRRPSPSHPRCRTKAPPSVHGYVHRPARHHHPRVAVGRRHRRHPEPERPVAHVSRTAAPTTCRCAWPTATTSPPASPVRWCANLPPTVDAGAARPSCGARTGRLPPPSPTPASRTATSLVCTWDFGDGQTATITACTSAPARVAHAWAQPGTYTATLTVQDKDGASASDTVVVTVTKRTTMVNVYAALSAHAAGDVEVAAKLVDRFELNRAMTGPDALVHDRTPYGDRGHEHGRGGGRLPALRAGCHQHRDRHATRATRSTARTRTPTPSTPCRSSRRCPSLRYDRSEQVAMVPSPGGRVANGGVLSTVGFSAGYAPLILVVDPLVVGNPALPNPLPSFDTVALNGICDIGATQFLGNATFRGRVQDFVLHGRQADHLGLRVHEHRLLEVLPALHHEQPRRPGRERHRCRSPRRTRSPAAIPRRPPSSTWA